MIIKVSKEKKKMFIKRLTVCIFILIPIFIALSVFVNINFIEPKTGYAIDDSTVPGIFNGIIAVLTVALFILSFFYDIPFVKKQKKSKAKASSEIKTLSDDESESVSQENAFGDNNGDDLLVSGDNTATDEFSEELSKNAEENDHKVKEDNKTVTDGASLILVTDSPLMVFITALLGFMFLSVFGLLMFKDLGPFKDNLITYAVLLLSACCGVFFIYSSAKNVYPHGLGYSFAYSVPTIWAAFRLIMCFASQHNNVNIETSFFTLMTSCAMMFFFHNEALFTLKFREKYNLRAYIFFAQCVVMYVSLHSIPNIILACFWITGFTNETLFSLLELIVGMYAFMRLLILCRRLSKEKYDIVCTDE